MMPEVTVITFGLLLSLLTLSKAQQNCYYSGKLEPGQVYYAYNPNYDNLYTSANNCTWKPIGSDITISCDLKMPSSWKCYQDSLSITFAGGETNKYCGTGSFTVKGTNPTVSFYSPSYTRGGTFLCKMQAEDSFDEYRCNCGWKNPTMIVGGNATGINEYPMMAGLVDAQQREVYCGATIIDKQYVMTAAHCIIGRNYNVIGVLVGDHDLLKGDDTNAAKMYRINGCKTHPSYDINNNPSYYDIAICQINGTIEFNAKVGPVCLPFQRRYDSFSGSKVTLLGWGLLEFGGRKATELQGVKVSVISPYDCKNAYKKEATSSHLCTFAPGKDSCQMDSGGPVLWENPTTHRIVQAAIIYGGRGCGSPDDPSLNTRVGDYVDWITSITPGAKYCKVE